MSDELKLRDEWFAEAKQQTLETLPAFLKKLSEHPHDYGTICRAMGAAAIGAAWAIEHSPSGGITGFQASCVMWDFVQGWMSYSEPLSLMKASDLLYPQYADRYTTVSPSVWEWVQKQAKANIDTNERTSVHPDVWSHWESIVAGTVPFGLSLAKND